MELFIELHDHDGICHNDFSYEFDSEATFNLLKEKIQSTFHIEPSDQHLFSVDGRRINGFGSSMLLEIGLKYGDKVIVKHAQLHQWLNYLKRIDEFRETQDKRLKKEKAFEALQKAKQLYEANFFSAYATFDSDWLRMRKEYATFLDNIPIYIKEAAKSFFTRKFSNKLIVVDFKDKPSGTRSGAMCIVNFDDTRRVFYVKTNHNASSISITHRGPLNMIELYIYKLLEVLGVGAIVEFIPNVVASDKIVYICGEEIPGFKTLAMLQKDWDAFERKIAKKKGETASAIIQLSLLAQILGLDDLHAENIGFNETSASLYIVDFRTGFIDTAVGFEGINRPARALSLVAQLKMNLGRFFDLVKEMTFEEQLKIGKECIVQWEINSKLDMAFEKLDEEKNVFHRADLLFARGTENLKEYITDVREKINQINNL